MYVHGFLSFWLLLHFRSIFHFLLHFRSRFPTMFLWSYLWPALGTIALQLAVPTPDTVPAARLAAVFPGAWGKFMGFLQGALKLWPINTLPGFLWQDLLSRSFWFLLGPIPMPILIFFFQADIFHIKNLLPSICVKFRNI